MLEGKAIHFNHEKSQSTHIHWQCKKATDHVIRHPQDTYYCLQRKNCRCWTVLMSGCCGVQTAHSAQTARSLIGWSVGIRDRRLGDGLKAGSSGAGLCCFCSDINLRMLRLRIRSKVTVALRLLTLLEMTKVTPWERLPRKTKEILYYYKLMKFYNKYDI